MTYNQRINQIFLAFARKTDYPNRYRPTSFHLFIPAHARQVFSGIKEIFAGRRHIDMVL
jgi:hypothetical protein